MSEVMSHRASDDGVRRITATMPFAIDRRVPGALHAAVVRSQVPHGTILEIDAEEALARPGVRQIIVGADLVDHPRIVSPMYGEGRQDQPVLAIERVRYVGEPVAIVLADTREAARRAARTVFVDHDELPFETDHLRAGEPGAPALHEAYPDNECGTWDLLHGDPDEGWQLADRIFEHEYHSPPASHVPLEPHVATARWQGDRLEVWSGTQSPYSVQARLRSIFGADEDAIRIRGDNLGGAFGAKTDARIEPMVAVASLLADASVRLELDREEVFKTLAKHGARVRIRTGVRVDGTFTARAIDIVYNAGAYANTTPRSTRTGMIRSPGPYRIPHVQAHVRGTYTATVPTGPFRGAMTGQICWAHESTIDEIAHELGLDPLEVRRRNVLQQGDTYATGEQMHDIRYLDVIDALAADLGSVGEPSGPSMARGLGFALVIKSTRTPSRSEAHVEARPDGRFHILTSSVDMGQGGHVALARELARTLHVDVEAIDVSCADTAHTPFDQTTSSSRTTFCMGNAIRDAGANLLAELRAAAAKAFGVGPKEVRHESGRFRCGERSLGVDEVSAAHGDLLRASGVYATPDGMGELDPATTQGIASVHWHQGGVGVEVEVDRETGVVRIVRARGASYAGRVVDPFKVRQQTEGGIVFGLGQAMFEELQYDEGQLTNPNMSDYLIPSILDVPADLLGVTLANDAPDADVHGVGENTVPPVAPAIANAIHDAVTVRIRDLPLTPEKVLRGLREQTMEAR